MRPFSARVISGSTPVSILTQVVSWVRPQSYDDQITPLQFQSSPKLSPGCDAAGDYNSGITIQFQSSPKLSPGCDSSWRCCRCTLIVSILTQVVSWVRPLVAVTSDACWMFQSSPKLSPGCDWGRLLPATSSTQFQSSPKLSPGCDHLRRPPLPKVEVSILTQVVSWVRRRQWSVPPVPSKPDVSILTQVVSWVRRSPTRHTAQSRCSFNPHPSCLLGATVDSDCRHASGSIMFQSSPKLSPGCDRQSTELSRAVNCFNPHPSCLLGATSALYVVAMRW